MSIETREVIKTWYVKHAKPTEEQFSIWLDSYVHSSDMIPIDRITDLIAILANTADRDSFYQEVQNRIDADDAKYDKTGGIISGPVTIKPTGWISESLDPQFSIESSGDSIALCNGYGQWQFRGKGASANMSFHNRLNNVYAFFNTLGNNGYFDLNDKDGIQKVHIDSVGVSKMPGLDLSDNELIGVKDGTEVDHGATVGQLQNIETGLLDGVSEEGNTLQKLHSLIMGVFTEKTVANIAARDALSIEHLPTQVYVLDDGDGKWALYKALSTGVAVPYIKLSDPDLLNAQMTASAIKTAYESNSDTNALTNALKSKLDSMTAIFTAALKSAYDNAANLAHASGSDNQVASTLPVVDSFTGNLQGKNITDAQSALNAIDQMSAGSTGIPNPATYTYSGNLVSKAIEDVGGGLTIEKRYRYYAAGSGQDGSLDIMEVKNTKANLWIRTTYVYTAGKCTSISNSLITAWTI